MRLAKRDFLHNYCSFASFCFELIIDYFYCGPMFQMETTRGSQLKVNQCDFMENPDLHLEVISTRVKAHIPLTQAYWWCPCGKTTVVGIEYPPLSLGSHHPMKSIDPSSIFQFSRYMEITWRQIWTIGRVLQDLQSKFYYLIVIPTVWSKITPFMKRPGRLWTHIIIVPLWTDRARQ
jgi:hypothetical protein